jgi:DNA-binding transcriptional MerR regulator
MTERGRLPIGTFAAKTGLSIKALRLYDKLDLLVPAEIDPESGYRYYEHSQERRAKLIFLMRRMDMPLGTIRRILDATDIQAAEIAACYQHDFQRRVTASQAILPTLLALLRNEEIQMIFEVQKQTIPQMQIAGIKKNVVVEDLEKHIHRSIATLQTNAGDRVTGDFFGIYHGEVNEKSDGPMEIAVQVKGAGSIDGAQMRTLPETEAAIVDVPPDQCHFPAILGAYDAAAAWMSENNYRQTDSPRETWICDADEMRMQIIWPCEPNHDANGEKDG